MQVAAVTAKASQQSAKMQAHVQNRTKAQKGNKLTKNRNCKGNGKRGNKCMQAGKGEERHHRSTQKWKERK